MGDAENKTKKIEEFLFARFQKKGFLLEDEIIDVCIDNDLELAEIDRLCDKLLSQNVIVADSVSSAGDDEDDEEEDDIVDRSHMDYGELLETIRKEHPNCSNLIDEILSITPPQHREWRNLIKEAQRGNPYARERMTLMYLRTIMKQAYYFSKSYYCDFEDAFQNGVAGLILAMDKFDADSPDNFQSYFALYAMQMMHRHLSVRGTIMRYPIHYMEKISFAVSNLTSIMEDDNMEESIKISSGESYMRHISPKYLLPYVEIPEDYPYYEPAYGHIEREQLPGIVQGLLSPLNERERTVLTMRYGIAPYTREHTLEEIGAIFNLTRERIRQIESKALWKIRKIKRCEVIALREFLGD